MNILLNKRKDILLELKHGRMERNKLNEINKSIIQCILDNPDIDSRVKEFHKLNNVDKKKELIEKYNVFLNLYEYLNELQDTKEIVDILKSIEKELKEMI